MTFSNLFRYVILSGILFQSAFVNAQEITDTRRKTESFAKLHPADIRSEVAFFTFGGITESANAPKLNKIIPTTVTRDSLIIDGNGIYAKVVLEPFDPKAHKIIYDDDEKTPIKIDRKAYYGDYGKMPVKSIGSILMIIQGDTVAIPEAAYADLKNMRFTYILGGAEKTSDGVFISKDGKRTYLYLFSKNNSGNYEVTYIFQDKQYLKRVLDYDFL